jgi:cellulose synthase (UDP-forming)
VEPCEGVSPQPPVAVSLSHVAQLGETSRCGLSFTALKPAQYRAVAELMYGDAGAIARFLEGRRKPIGLVRGSARFMLWGVTEPLRALAYAFRKRPDAETATVVAEPAPVIAPAFDPAAFAAIVQSLAAQTHPVATAEPRLSAQDWLASIVTLSGTRPPVASDDAPLLAGAA